MIKKFCLKNATVLIILSFLIGFSIFPNIESSENHYNYLALRNDSGDIPLLKQIGPVGTYEDYINSLEDKPFIFQTQAVGPISQLFKYKPPGFRSITIRNSQIKRVNVYSLHLKEDLSEDDKEAKQILGL